MHCLAPSVPYVTQIERTAQRGTELLSPFPYLYSRPMLAVPSRNINAEQQGMLVGDPESQPVLPVNVPIT